MKIYSYSLRARQLTGWEGSPERPQELTFAFHLPNCEMALLLSPRPREFIIPSLHCVP